MLTRELIKSISERLTMRMFGTVRSCLKWYTTKQTKPFPVTAIRKIIASNTNWTMVVGVNFTSPSWETKMLRFVIVQLRKLCRWRVRFKGEHRGQESYTPWIPRRLTWFLNSAKKSSWKLPGQEKVRKRVQVYKTRKLQFLLMFRLRKFFCLWNKNKSILYFYSLWNKQLFQLSGKQFSFVEVFPF